MRIPSALLVIDVQRAEFESTNPIHNPDELLANLQTLIKNCRKADGPIIYVQHDGWKRTHYEPGTTGWQIHPEIMPAENDIVVRKRRADCFYETDLDDRLQALRVKRLVVAGIETEVCVDTACRRAYSLGYKVVLAKDTHSTTDWLPLKAEEIIEHHNNVLGKWFARLEESKNIQF